MWSYKKHLIKLFEISGVSVDADKDTKIDAVVNVTGLWMVLWGIVMIILAIASDFFKIIDDHYLLVTILSTMTPPYVFAIIRYIFGYTGESITSMFDRMINYADVKMTATVSDYKDDRKPKTKRSTGFTKLYTDAVRYWIKRDFGSLKSIGETAAFIFIYVVMVLIIVAVEAVICIFVYGDRKTGNVDLPFYIPFVMIASAIYITPVITNNPGGFIGYIGRLLWIDKLRLWLIKTFDINVNEHTEPHPAYNMDAVLEFLKSKSRVLEYTDVDDVTLQDQWRVWRVDKLELIKFCAEKLKLKIVNGDEPYITDIEIRPDDICIFIRYPRLSKLDPRNRTIYFERQVILNYLDGMSKHTHEPHMRPTLNGVSVNKHTVDFIIELKTKVGEATIIKGYQPDPDIPPEDLITWDISQTKLLEFMEDELNISLCHSPIVSIVGITLTDKHEVIFEVNLGSRKTGITKDAYTVNNEALAEYLEDKLGKDVDMSTTPIIVSGRPEATSISFTVHLQRDASPPKHD